MGIWERCFRRIKWSSVFLIPNIDMFYRCTGLNPNAKKIPLWLNTRSPLVQHTLILESTRSTHTPKYQNHCFFRLRAHKAVRHATYVPASTASDESGSGPPQTSEDIERGSWLGPLPSHFFRRCEFSPPPRTWSASDASESSAAAAAALLAAS